MLFRWVVINSASSSKQNNWQETGRWGLLSPLALGETLPIAPFLLQKT